MDDPRSELESMLSYSIDAELPFSLERKYVLHHVLAFWSPSPLGPDQILAKQATTIAVIVTVTPQSSGVGGSIRDIGRPSSSYACTRHSRLVPPCR